MGSSNSIPETVKPNVGSPSVPKAAASPGGCPMHSETHRKNMTIPAANGCPLDYGTHGDASSEPVLQNGLDPRNMMPTNLEDKLPDQDFDLSKHREKSSIPKTGSSKTWEYPSPQQFYNSLLRKNKDPDSQTMDAVVYVHNVVNEETWNQILAREAMHQDSCEVPTLQRFVGKYDDLTWKGRISELISSKGRPYDRHDWFVDRCGQRTVRYIVDYYDDDNAENRQTTTTVDARPAFDTAEDVWDRIRFPIWKHFYGGKKQQDA